jgi:hypothetical protein
MDVEVWMISPGKKSGNAALACEFSMNGRVVFNDRKKLAEPDLSPLVWTKIHKTFIIPDVNDSSLQINVFIDTRQGSLLFADDLKIMFHYDWKR